MRGDLLLLLADAIAILCITRFLLRYAGLAAEHPLLKFSIQATGWLTKPWQKAFPSGAKTDWYCLPQVFWCTTFLHRHYFHLAGAVHQQ